MRKWFPAAALLLWIPSLHGQPQASFDTSFFVAPLYVGYGADSDEKFSREVVDLRRRLGVARYVQTGFAAFLYLGFPDADLGTPTGTEAMAFTLSEIDRYVERARVHGIGLHLSVVSGFFHNWNEFRASAVRQDVRNAQWFADGWIGPPEDLRESHHVPLTVWITPSRYAEPFRSRLEEGVRLVASRLAHHMATSPATLLTVSGDGEVELTYERNFANGGERFGDLKETIYADYSPFAVAEFRDSLRVHFPGDASPATDDDRDGRTFNAEYGQAFTSWKLRYFDESGPISLSEYMSWSERLPSSGRFFIDGGFDAPRREKEGDRFWKAWLDFRKLMVKQYVRDFTHWMTSSPDPITGFRIPAPRIYSHQIPADYLLGQNNSLRLRTSASYVETAVTAPLGSTGATVFNGYDGRRHVRTAGPDLFSALSANSPTWGILEYNPSIPYDNKIAASDDEGYFLGELRMLHVFRPKLIVPFAWSDYPDHRRFNIKGSTFERVLSRWIQEIGHTPWRPMRTP